MLFNSFEFLLVFLPLSVFVYWALRHSVGLTASNVALTGFSLWFYFTSERNYTFLIGASIVFNYVIGALMARGSKYKNALVWVGVVGDLGALGYFKYANFAVENIQAIFLDFPSISHIELPIGISFFTFTQIAFLVDCYRGEVKGHNVVSYCLFVLFYPHLVAGPILHHAEMMPQFLRRTKAGIAEHVAAGLMMFAIGLFKKTVIADAVAPVVSQLFGAGSAGGLTLLPAWIAALAYAVQIYFDFSGYSDMAVGIARAFGINLPVNFNSPYKATSLSDFWRRWHITLSRFLRDYLYIPLGGNRRGKLRNYANLVLTMLLGGIWHGAAWTFVLWGLVHGVWLALERLLISRWPIRLSGGRVGASIGRCVTLAVVVFAWVPFRAPDLATTFHIWVGMIGFNGVALPADWPLMSQVAANLGVGLERVALHPVELMLVVLAFVAAATLPNSQQILSSLQLGLDSPGYRAVPEVAKFWRVRPTLMWALYFGVVLGVACAFVGGYTEFIYFQF